MGKKLMRCQYDTGFFYFNTVVSLGLPSAKPLFAILESFAGPDNGAGLDKADKAPGLDRLARFGNVPGTDRLSGQPC